MRLTAIVAAAGALAALAWAACSSSGPLAGVTPQPVVQQQTFSAVEGSLKLVAVMPFYPRPELGQRLQGDLSPDDVADLVSGYFAEALRDMDVRIVPPSDVVLAFTNKGRALSRLDPRTAAEVMGPDFGLSAIVAGEVYRWHDREGDAYGAVHPSSVGFEASLYALDGRRLWRGRFDHTQRTLTGNFLAASKYPGGGTRWLSVNELARWGARNAVQGLVDGQWRASR